MTRYDHYFFIFFVYLLSRVLLSVSGVSFYDFSDVMHFLDPKLLEQSPFLSSFYTHNFPPLMNFFLGICLQIFGVFANEVIHIVFMGLGVLGSFSFLYILNTLFGKKKRNCLIVTLYMLLPASIFFENLLFHTYPSAQIFLISFGVLLRSLQKKTCLIHWSSFFFLISLLTYLRSIFHISWMTLVFLFLVNSQKSNKKIIFKAALIPFILTFSLYMKNYLIFGFFGSSSWFGISLAKQTVYQLPIVTKKKLLKKGVLSPSTKLSTFSEPKEYSRFFSLAKKKIIFILTK